MPLGSGAKPSIRFFAFAKAIPSIVLPWKEAEKEIISFLFLWNLVEVYFLAVFTAASIDSAPELQKKTFSAKVFWHNFFAKFIAGIFIYRFDKCHAFLDWWFKILTKSLLLWPKFVTAMPAVKSIYFLLLTSQTYEPFAFFTTKSAGP